MDALLRQLCDGPLLSLAQRAELVSAPPVADNLTDLVKVLVQRGWLTPFQANEIVRGRTDRLVLGSYVLLARLGQGGMGEVFLARHSKLGRVVALKVLRKERLGNADLVRRFRREIQAAARLSHPNVVLAYDADEVNGIHFFAMEYVEGTDLEQLVAQIGPLPIATACAYIRQAALGLQHAFERGMVHRDIKPSNLLLSRDGQLLKLLDLGLARLGASGTDQAPSSLTEMGTVMGTLDYLAPEQARNARSVDIRADLYSLGCTLYHLLAGRPPFADCTRMEKLFKHQWEEPTPIEEHRPDIPPDVAALIRRLMAKRPEDRLQTPAELIEALVRFTTPATPLPVRTTEATNAETSTIIDFALSPAQHPPERPGKQGWQRQLTRRALMATAIAVALMLTLSVVLFLLARLPPADATDPRPPDQPSERVDAERTALERLITLHKGKGDPETFRRELVSFQIHHPRRPDLRIRAAEELRPLPSPFDRLDRNHIPPTERCTGQPEELVAVLGEHHLRAWLCYTAVAFSPDGRLLATSGAGATRSSLWDLESRREVLSFNATFDPFSLVFWPDSARRWLITGAVGAVKVFDLAHPVKERSLLITLDLRSVVCSPALIAAGGKKPSPPGTETKGAARGIVYLFDPTKAVPHVGTLEAEGVVLAQAFSPDGGQLAASIQGEEPPPGKAATHQMVVWDVATRQVKATVPIPRAPIRWLTYAPDGKWLVTGDLAGEVVFWDTKTFRPSHRYALRGGGAIARLVFSRDGKWLAIAREGIGDRVEVQVWDAAARRVVQTATPPLQFATLAFSPDGETLAMTGRGVSEVLRWRWRQGPMKPETTRSGHWAPVTSLSVSPDGMVITATATDYGDGCNLVWDLGKGPVPQFRAVHPPQGAVLTQFDMAGRLNIVRDDGSVWLDALSHPPPPKKGAFLPAARYFVLSDDGQQLAALTGDGVEITDLKTAQWVCTFKGNEDPYALALSPDGATLAVGSRDQLVRLWSLSRRNLLAHPFSPITPEERAAGRLSPFARLLFSPDSRTLAVLIRHDNFDAPQRLHLLDRKTGQCLTPDKGLFQIRSRAMAFSPDNRLLAVAEEDYGTVHLWHLPPGKAPVPGKQIVMPGAVHQLAFAPDSRHLLTGNGNGTVYILRLDGLPGGK